LRRIHSQNDLNTNGCECELIPGQRQERSVMIALSGCVAAATG
jgi:hypothetical protein